MRPPVLVAETPGFSWRIRGPLTSLSTSSSQFGEIGGEGGSVRGWLVSERHNRHGGGLLETRWPPGSGRQSPRTGRPIPAAGTRTSDGGEEDSRARSGGG